MEQLAKDIRYAVRTLFQARGFSFIAVVTLALGLGATISVFSLIEGVLLRPLPFRDPDRLVALTDVIQGADLGGPAGVTGPDVVAYTRDTRSFSSLGGYAQITSELTGVGEPAMINASRVTAGVLTALGVQPLIGRVFTSEEDQQKQHVAVLSYATWQERFHGNRGVLGRKILLDREPYILIGVMPRNFEFPLLPGQLSRSELWVPMSFAPDEISPASAGGWNFQMIARLKPGVSAEQAQADANRVAQEIVAGYPSFMRSIRMSAQVRPLKEDTIEQVRPLLRTLFLAVAVVLLIACANLAGLLLMRAIRRRHDTAVRLALGASASSLLRQAVAEGVVLSGTGGLAGLGLAAIAVRAGKSFLPESLPLISQIRLDLQVVLFAFLLALCTGVLCAIAPAFAAMRTSVNLALKEGGRTGKQSSGHARLRSALVVAEIAVALILLNASGLLLRSFEKMRAVHLGFVPDHTLTAAYSLPRTQYANATAIHRFDDELLNRFEHLPGIRAAAVTSVLPTSASSHSGFMAENYNPPPGAGMSLASVSQVMGDYFNAMGISLLHGRTFTPADKDGAPLVAIVNRKLAEHYWPGQDAIGKRIRWGVADTPTPWMTVVGEVDDVKQDSPDKDTSEQIYQPTDQMAAAYGPFGSSAGVALAGNAGFIVVSTSLPPEQMAQTMITTVHGLDPQLALTQLQTLENVVAGSEAPRRFNTGVITAFAAAAVLLAIVGIYSVIAFSVTLRIPEMAIRMALGSQRIGVLRLILITGAKLAGIGCALGLIGALAVSPLLRALLFAVSPFDPMVLAVAIAVVLLLALAASMLPARRAASIDPMQALRAE